MSSNFKNHVIIPLCATQISEARGDKCQIKISQELLNTINALLNSPHRGKLTLRFDKSPPSHVKECVRKIEQKLSESTGVTTLVYNLKINKTSDKDCSFAEIYVSSDSDDVVTLNYNMYLPTNQQIIAISSKDSVGKVRKICRGEMPRVEAIKPGSHLREFTQGAVVPCGESQTIQFKKIESTPKKRTTLAQRLVKNNKLKPTVSAFANYAGGHIYIGINDDGSVEGEKITDEDKEGLEKAIGKAVLEMVWPESNLVQGKEDKRWHIYFELVKSSSGETIPETFVIVIYVAQCPGGVFAKEPEAYEIVEGEVKKIAFSAWKEMILHGLVREKGEESSETSGDDALYISVHELLTGLLNDNCGWSDLKQTAENAETEHNKVEVRLICLAKLVKYCIRKGDHKTAEETLREYKETLPTCRKTEVDVFEVIELYLRSLWERSKSHYMESYKIAKSTLEKVNKIRPGIVSTEFYVLAATVVNILAMQTDNSSESEALLPEAMDFYNYALKHLEHVCKSKSVKADLEQKIYTMLTMFYSGSSLAGCKLTNPRASIVDETEAQHYLNKIHHIATCKKFPLGRYRDIQYYLAQSDHFYQASKSEEDRKNDHLKQALKFAKDAAHLADMFGFPEMKLFAESRIAQIIAQIKPSNGHTLVT